MGLRPSSFLSCHFVQAPLVRSCVCVLALVFLVAAVVRLVASFPACRHPVCVCLRSGPQDRCGCCRCSALVCCLPLPSPPPVCSRLTVCGLFRTRVSGRVAVRPASVCTCHSAEPQARSSAPLMARALSSLGSRTSCRLHSPPGMDGTLHAHCAHRRRRMHTARCTRGRGCQSQTHTDSAQVDSAADR